MKRYRHQLWLKVTLESLDSKVSQADALKAIGELCEKAPAIVDGEQVSVFTPAGELTGFLQTVTSEIVPGDKRTEKREGQPKSLMPR